MSRLKRFSIIMIIASLSFSFACSGDKKKDDDSGSKVSKKIRALIKSVTGKAVMYNGGQSSDLKAGVEITKADSIETFTGSKCVVLFSTGSTLSLQQNTKIKIKILLPKGVRSQVEDGGVLMNVKKLSENEEFSVNTPTAVAGVRGTQFYVSYDKKAQRTKVAVKEGKVNVVPSIDVSTDDETKAKITKAVSVDVNSNEVINLEKRQVEEINTKIKTEIKEIEEAKTDQEVKEKLKVQESKKILTKQKIQTSEQEKKVFEELPETTETAATEQVHVAISQPDATITVNGKTEQGIYAGYHDKGTKLTVKIEKEGFSTFNKEYTIPENETSFSPIITLAPAQQQNQDDPDNQDETSQQNTEGTKWATVKKDLPRIASKFSVGTGSKSSLYTQNGKVFFIGNDAKFYIVDMKAGGSIVKTVPINAAVESTPLVYRGVIYFGAVNNRLYAINVNNGRILFSKALAGPLALKNSIVARGNAIYTGTSGFVYKMNRLNGKEIWKKGIGGENIWAAVAVDNKHVYVADEGDNIRALKISNGSEVWKQKIARVTLGRVLKYGNKVVINLHDGSLRAVSAINGKPININVKVGRLLKSPYQHGALAYYPTTRGLRVFNLANLKLIGYVNTQGVPHFDVAGRNLYAGVGGGELKEMSLVGASKWSVKLGGKLSHNPVSDKLYVYALTNDGTLYKINKREFEMVRKRVK